MNRTLIRYENDGTEEWLVDSEPGLAPLPVGHRSTMPKAALCCSTGPYVVLAVEPLPSRSYRVEVTGWNAEGESVEDSTDVVAHDGDEALDAALPKMISRSSIVEVGDSRASVQS